MAQVTETSNEAAMRALMFLKRAYCSGDLRSSHLLWWRICEFPENPRSETAATKEKKGAAFRQRLSFKLIRCG